MQVTEINAQGLKREFQVLLAAQELERQWTQIADPQHVAIRADIGRL